MASLRLALEQAERILDRVDPWPVQDKQLEPRAAREDDAGFAVTTRIPSTAAR